MRPAPSAPADPDVDLMLRVQADEVEAFDALYERFNARAFRVAYSVVLNRLRAEEIVQEAFLSIWTSRLRYRPAEGRAAAWVIGVVRHKAIDSLRHNIRHDRLRASDSHIDEERSAPGDIEETVGRRDQDERLRKTLAQLPPTQRDVITLAYFGELSSPEIAKELSLPLGTVKGRMRLGLEKLRHALSA